MLVKNGPSEVRAVVRRKQREGAVVGVVPTMGALHAGHVSLIEAARSECDFVLTTIFVNPTQFGPNEDYQKYPRTLEDDLQKCASAGSDLVFTPDLSEMYSDDAQTVVCVTGLTQQLEGAIRPGHFDGVTTVVAKLFNITQPDRAYFGQKDYQQQLVIRRMVRDLNWGIEIVTCPIVREPDGLAMSSRNRYLSTEDRQRALVLHQAVIQADTMTKQKCQPAEIQHRMAQLIRDTNGVQLDYAVVLDSTTLTSPGPTTRSVVAMVAAKVGSTRLIDNCVIDIQLE